MSFSLVGVSGDHSVLYDYGGPQITSLERSICIDLPYPLVYKAIYVIFTAVK